MLQDVVDAIGRLAGPWAYVVIGGLAGAEAAAFVGLVLPGETALIVGGFLAYRGKVNLPVLIAVAVAAAIVGDSIGYEIGRVMGPPLRRSRLGRKVGEERWERAAEYVRAKGGRAVFLGRWVGVLRALVPTLSGMSGMPYRTFLPANVAGALTWAPAAVLVGYAAGESYREVGRAVGGTSLGLAVVVVATIVIVRNRRHRRSDGRSDGRSEG